MSDDDKFIASFLFPNEISTFTPAPDNIRREVQRLETLVDSDYKCPHCNRVFSNKSNLNRHTKNIHSANRRQTSASANLTCEKCDKSFTKNFNLLRHEKTCKGKKSETCDVCEKRFTNKRCLNRHMLLKHALTCPVCKQVFESKLNLKTHVGTHLSNDFLTVKQVQKLRRITGRSILLSTDKTSQQPGTSGTNQNVNTTASASAPISPEPVFDQTSRPIHGNAGILYTINPTGLARHSMLNLFSEKRENLIWNLNTAIERWNSVRWYIAVRARMLRFDNEGNIRDEERPTFRSSAQILLDSDRIEFQIDQAFFKVNLSLESFCSSASGWMLEEILYMEQFIFRYAPLGGNCGDLSLPARLSNTRALITVTGRPANTKDCFVWSVVAALHHDPELHTGSVHWTCFEEYRTLYRIPESMKTDETVTIVQIPDFEKLNKVSVNVFAYDRNVIFPLYVSTFKGARGHADLLLITVLNEETGDSLKHFCAITDLGRLVRKQQEKTHKSYVCPRCLTTKYSESDLQKHKELCMLVDPLHVKMPEAGGSFVEFRNYTKQLEMPFLIVARFECFRRPILDLREPTEGVTVRERFHEPCAFAYYRVSVDDSHPSSPVFFTDDSPETVMNEFLRCMQREQAAAMEIMKTVKPMVYCDEGIRNIEASNDNCHICGDAFVPDQKVVLDHDHISGKIRGRACLGCNLNFRLPNHIVIVLNDLSAYDGRIVLSAAGIHGTANIRVIPKSIDTYAGIMIDKCRFIDFQSFFKEPLDNLIKDFCTEEGDRNCLEHTKRHWPVTPRPSDLMRIPLCRDFLRGPEDLHATALPPIEMFADELEGSALSEEEYNIVSDTWSSLSNRCMQELLKVALITDCLFTSDIIQIFRKNVRKELKLDPVRYFTLASFAWDCALRYSETKLQLQTSLEAHLMIENAIRGGIAVTGNPRYSVANNKDMPAGMHNETEETSYIDFLDFNGLYTSIMSSARLPAYGFRFLTDYELERFDFSDIPADSDHGYILEVDLSYPAELHDEHDSFPMAPEKINLCKEDISPYTINTAADAGINLDNVCTEQRLCLTLKDKKSYTLHYLNLQFYTKYGLQVTKIHRVLTFVQTPFLHSYMQYCGDKRKEALSPVHKTLWKNLCNLVCGKSYENPRHYKDIRICNSESSLLKLVAKPSFDCLRILDDNLTAVQMHRTQVVLNKPIAVGFAILELSKLSVYSFYYDFVKKKLAKDAAVSFLAGDTDSLVLKISGVGDLTNRYKTYKSLFDFSNLPPGHPLYDNENKMIPGKVKFERPGEIGLEFISLSPKCYSLKTDKGYKQARKGSSKEIKHEIYKKCLTENNCHRENVNEIRHYNQKLYRVSVNKRVLNILDFKRHHFDALTSVSFGHYSLNQV